MWTMEDRPRSTNVARHRNIVSDRPDESCEKTTSTSDVQTDFTMALQEMVKIITQQGKAIGELTNAVRELTTQTASSEDSRGVKAKPKPKYTREGQPICLRCEGVGHMARHCNAPRQPTSQSATMPSSPLTSTHHCYEPGNARQVRRLKGSSNQGTFSRTCCWSVP